MMSCRIISVPLFVINISQITAVLYTRHNILQMVIQMALNFFRRVPLKTVVTDPPEETIVYISGGDVCDAGCHALW